ncbi:MAG: DUF4263 domain-containing protein [Hydrogenophaga sp.]|nr:DUF4263 domain-containing protein [Hydrogenophaga sp.]
MQPDEEEIFRNKRDDKTYISRAFPTVGGMLRIASKVFDVDGLHHAVVKKEVVLRTTPKRRTEIIAKFFEDDRALQVVTIQAFNGETGKPHRTHFSFIGSQIPKLLTFFHDIATMELNGSGKVNISDAELRRLSLSKEQATSLVQDNQDVFVDVLQTEVTKEDVVALGYRKHQLRTFENLLNDADYFQQVKEKKGARGDEALWQMFFEKNQWVFGYGLSYFFVTGFEGRKLEQVVQGHDLLNRGKRADGVLKKRGIINALCFAEIKKHTTPLLGPDSYRPGCWAPSSELAGAVAQVQTTVAAAMRTLYGLVSPKDAVGNPTGEEVFNFKPKAFIVVGSLGEFLGEHGVNTDKMRSFELYRNNLAGIDILTFDELYERTKFIVDAAVTPK